MEKMVFCKNIGKKTVLRHEKKCFFCRKKVEKRVKNKNNGGILGRFPTNSV